MVTYGRFNMVQRSISMFLAQTLTDSELIILHTDTDQALVMDFEHPRLRIINNSIDYLTGLPYTNTGSIRRDCLTHATGQYYVCWDDDDIFLPWALQQAYDGVSLGNEIAWKPAKSFYRNGSGEIELVRNTMEASCIIGMQTLREIGFNLSSGPEGLSWYIKLRNTGLLDENNDRFCPSYCFDWSYDPQIGHRQSGGINDPNNFDNHIKKSQDRPNGRMIRPEKIDLRSIYAPFYSWLDDNSDRVDPEYHVRYVEHNKILDKYQYAIK